MWYEYPIPANYELQRRIIRHLKTMIETLEENGSVEGFAFNHYFQNNEVGNLCIRFDCEEENLENVRTALDAAVSQFIPNFDSQAIERLWDNMNSHESVYKAYELGTRCVFLFCDLVEQGRIDEDFASNFVRIAEGQIGLAVTEFTFQSCFMHGLMNSLGVSKSPNEQILHLASLIESTESKTPEELCNWTRRFDGLFPPETE